MSVVYQIKDWNIHFENDRSRTRDKCQFVCVPNKQHGMGFSYLMAEKDGTMVYGVFHLMLGACSQQRKERAGWLTTNGKSDGSPWTASDMATKFRRPVDEISRALEVLSSSNVGWLTAHSPSGHREVTPESPSGHRPLTVQSPTTDLEDFKTTHRPVTDHSPSSHLEENGREGKEEKEEKGTPISPEAELLPPDGEEKSTPRYRRSKTLELAKPILEYLNEKTGRKYQETEDNLTSIACRLEEISLDTEGVKKMIDRQCSRWLGDEKMEEYLRVSTLFNRTKFHEYYSARDLSVAPRKQGQNHEKGF
jgi:uncharacterized phage protein (TIGR02220 family)